MQAGLCCSERLGQRRLDRERDLGDGVMPLDARTHGILDTLGNKQAGSHAEDSFDLSYDLKASNIRML